MNATRSTLPADTHQQSRAPKGTAKPTAPLEAGPVNEAQLTASLQKLEATARQQAKAIDQSAHEITGGHAVARGFNHVVNFFTHKEDHLETARKNAVTALTSTLPKDLEKFHTLVTAAGSDPAKLKAANDFLQSVLNKTQHTVDGYQSSATDLSKSNKFWSGVISDTIAGVGVAVGVGLCATGAGAPIGAGLIAASVAGGGALSVGAHLALDNQFDLRKEGLSTFVIGGITGAATALTAGASTAIAGRLSAGAAKVVGANAVKGALAQGAILATARGLTNGAMSAAITGTQAIAQEHATGFQAGAGKRIAKAVGIGAVGGFVGGAVWSGVSSALDAGLPALTRHLPGTLTSRVNAASNAIDKSRFGQIAWNTASGAFYGGPVGAAGTALAAWMTGETMTKEEVWNQVVAGAINGGAIYGTWAGTPGGKRDLEIAGSYALDQPGRLAPSWRKMTVKVGVPQRSRRPGVPTGTTRPVAPPPGRPRQPRPGRPKRRPPVRLNPP